MFKKLTRAQAALIQAILAATSLAFLLPLVNVVALSFRGGGWGNYRILFSTGLPLGRMFLNSMVVCALQVALIVCVSSIAAFAFSKLNFRGRDFIYALTLLSMSIPMMACLTPLFTIMKALNANNTYFALVVPFATFWMPVAVLIQKNYYDSIGNEMMEAAVMDGLSWFQIFRRIYFPLGLPAVVNVIVFAFIAGWNDFVNPMLFSKSQDMYTFPMAISAVTTSIRGSKPEVVFACCVIMAIPSVAVYLGLQKYLGQGMTAGAVKG
jgi:ABC-type glycerol-3-phosphate transport system permease component